MIFLGLVLGGVYLDKRYSTAPWLTLLGTALGGTAAFYTLYKAVYGVGRRRDSTADEGGSRNDASKDQRSTK